MPRSAFACHLAEIPRGSLRTARHCNGRSSRSGVSQQGLFLEQIRNEDKDEKRNDIPQRQIQRPLLESLPYEPYVEKFMPQLPCQRLRFAKRHHHRRLLGREQPSPSNGRRQGSELSVGEKHIAATLLRRKENGTHTDQVRIHLGIKPCLGTLHPAQSEKSRIPATPPKRSILQMHRSIHQNPALPNPQTHITSVFKQTQTPYPQSVESNKIKPEIKRRFKFDETPKEKILTPLREILSAIVFCHG